MLLELDSKENTHTKQLVDEGGIGAVVVGVVIVVVGAVVAILWASELMILSMWASAGA